MSKHLENKPCGWQRNSNFIYIRNVKKTVTKAGYKMIELYQSLSYI